MANALRPLVMGEIDHPPALDDQPELEGLSLDSYVVRANTLAEQILGNNQTYLTLKNQYIGLANQPENFSQGLFAAQCRAIDENANQLLLLHEAQEVQQDQLNMEFRNYLPTINMPPDEEQKQQVLSQILEFTRLINTSDDLFTVDEDLPTTFDGTCDCFVYLREPESWFHKCLCILFSCGAALCCNQCCCGLNGRVEQLKYAARKGIPS